MRIIFILLLLPFITKAQINRSASELAHENIKDYISTKIFKNRMYKPVSYGELKPDKEINSSVLWVLDHRFEVAESQTTSDKEPVVEQKLYRFIFYLDKKMKVARAENIKF
jgi:hypothetical protein